jgi:predicted  nucleic acid-binding Zn-ribbon protein
VSEEKSENSNENDIGVAKQPAVLRPLLPSKQNGATGDGEDQTEALPAKDTAGFVLLLISVSIGLGFFATSIFDQLFGLQSYQTFFAGLLTTLFVFSSVVWVPSWAKVGQGLPMYDRFRSLPFPTLFLSIGILGTFLGIYFGLSNLRLDATNPFSSGELRGLVEALSFSMTTSLLGISYAIIFRILEIVLGPQVDDDYGVQKIVSAIESMSAKLDDFVHDLADKVGAGLTDALQDLTSRLDDVLADQLGQAFRDLNDSIIQLNRWVDAYKEQVETLTIAYKENLTSIETFHEEAKKITNALALVPKQTEGIQSTLEKMNIPLSEFAEMGSRAKDAFPIIESKLEGMTTNFEGASDKLKETLSGLSNLQEELARKTGDVEGLIKEATEKQIADFGQQLAAISEKFAQDYVPITERLRDVLASIDTRPGE